MLIVSRRIISMAISRLLARSRWATFWLLMLMTPSQAFYALPDGWSEQKSKEMWAVLSPENDAGWVLLMVPVVKKQRGAFPVWFAQAAAEHIAKHGEAVERTPVVPAPGLRGALSTTYAVMTWTGERVFVFVVGYQTPAGGQLITITSPVSMNLEDPRIKQAGAFVNGLRAYDFALTAPMLGADEPADNRPNMPTAPPVASAVGTAGSSRNRCRDVRRPHQEAYTQQNCSGYQGGVRSCSSVIQFRTVYAVVQECD
jgi:hypothetical protein